MGIWKGRNELVFRNRQFNVTRILIMIKKAFAEWEIRTCLSEGPTFRGAISPRSTSNLLVRWNPPSGSIKLNFDGSCFHNSAAGGSIIRDWAGRLIKVRAAPYGDTSVLVAEARTLRNGLQEAVKQGFQYLEIEGDNIMVIQAIKGSTHMPWKISLIVKDILHFMKQLTHVSISHIYREANLAAD